MEDREYVERRKYSSISHDDIDAIATRAAEKAVEKITSNVYASIGRTVMQQFFWIIGVWSIAAYFWLKSNGIINK